MYFLFNVGGTKMRFSCSLDGINVDGIEVVDTPAKFEDGLVEFDKQYAAFSKIGKIDKISGGIAGVLDSDRRTILDSCNLPLWNNNNLVMALSSKYNCDVRLENDAALEGLGEAIEGSGKDYKIVAFVTVGTGLGGARIVNKMIDAKSLGFEPGHQIIDYKNSLDLGDIVSGGGFKKRLKTEAHLVTDQSVWDEASYALAIGIYNTIVHWSPDIVVIGGGLITENRYDVDKLNQDVRRISKNYPIIPPIIKSQLGDRAGMIGALRLAKY